MSISADEMHSPVALFCPVVSPKERDILSGLATCAQPLVPVIDLLEWIRRHEMRRIERASAVARDHKPRAMLGRAGIIEFLEAFKREANRTVRPLKHWAGDGGSCQPGCRHDAPGTPRFAGIL